MSEFLDQPVTVLGLPTRASHAFYHLQIRTVRDLVSKHARDILKYPNIGNQTVAEIRIKLAAHGLYLRGEPLPPPPPTMLQRFQAIEAKLDLILARLPP